MSRRISWSLVGAIVCSLVGKALTDNPFGTMAKAALGNAIGQAICYDRHL
jgi:hypothetical protein